MTKTQTQINFEIEIKNMMALIDTQRVTVKDAKHLVLRSINLLEHFKQRGISRDNWRKKFEDLKNEK